MMQIVSSPRVVLIFLICHAFAANEDRKVERKILERLDDISRHFEAAAERNSRYASLLIMIQEYKGIRRSAKSDRYDKLNEILTEIRDLEYNEPVDLALATIEKFLTQIRDGLSIKVLDTLNFVCLGKLEDIHRQYLKVWRDINWKTHKFYIWKDPDSFMAQYMQEQLVKHVDAAILKMNTVYSVKLRYMRIMMWVQNKMWHEVQTGMTKFGKSFRIAAKDAMVHLNLVSEQKVQDALEEYEKSWDVLREDGFSNIREIDNLWEADDEFKAFYYRELGIRQSLQAASEIASVRILKLFGGVYADVKLLPPLNQAKLDHLLSNPFLHIDKEQPNAAGIQEIRRGITKIIMDKEISPNSGMNEGVDFVRRQMKLQREGEIYGQFDWHLLYELIKDDSIHDWLVPLGDIEVPLGAEVGIGRLDGGVPTNSFMCATDNFGRHRRYNPGMESIEKRIIDNYKKIWAEGYAIPDGLWKNWSPDLKLYTARERYRWGGLLIPEVDSSRVITGSTAVSRGITDFIRDSGLSSDMQSRLNDHCVGEEYFNYWTDEMMNRNLFQRQAMGAQFKKASPTYKLILAVGDFAVSQLTVAYYKALDNERAAMFSWNPTEKRFDQVHSGRTFEQNLEPPVVDVVNFAILAHGDNTGELNEISPDDLARGLSALVPQDSVLGKISFTACKLETVIHDGRLKKHGFLDTFLKSLDDSLRERSLWTIRISVRHVDISLGPLGRKWGARSYINRQGKLAIERWRMSDSKKPYFKTIVGWDKHSLSFRGTRVEITHGEVALVDWAVDMSGVLHASFTSMDTPVSPIAALPNQAEYRDLSLDASFYHTSEKNYIITEPGFLALFNALRSSKQTIIVVGSSPKRLEGTRRALRALSDTTDINEGLKQLKVHFGSFGANFEKYFKKAAAEGVLFDHLKLKNRVSERRIIFLPMDMTAPESSNFLLTIEGTKNNIAAFYFSDQPNADNMSPSTFHQPEIIKRRALMNTLGESMRYGSGELRIPRHGGSNQIVSSVQELTEYETTKELLVSGEHFFKVLKAQKLIHSLIQPMRALKETHRIPDDFVLVFQSVRPEPDTNKYSLQMINKNDPDEVRQITTDDETIYTAAKELEEESKRLKKALTSKKRAGLLRMALHDEHLNSLNAGMFIIMVYHILNGAEFSKEEDSSFLSQAVKVQVWTNIAGGGLAGVSDVAHVIDLVQRGLREGTITSLETTAALVGDSFKMLANGGRAISGLVSALNVLFDIAELATAKSETDIATFATQTGVDTAFLTMSVVGAASSGVTAAVLAYLAFPLAGISIGLTALKGSYMDIVNNAKEVGVYFGRLEDGFKNPYRFENGKYLPNAVTVFRNIDLKNGKITLDSPLLTKTFHVSGSGDINFVAFQEPRMVYDPDNAFDIRERLNYPETQLLPPHHATDVQHTVVVLPIAPKSTIRYKYNLLPFATGRNDYGFSVLRALEKNEDFDFDFYIWPSEYIIQSITHVYHPTSIKVIMDDHDRILATPKPLEAISNMVTYEIQGSTGTTTIIIQKGVLVTLTEDPESSNIPWILDSSSVAENATSISVSTSSKVLNINGAIINYAGLASDKSSILIRTKTDIFNFKIETGNYVEEEVSGSPFTSDSLHAHLMKLVEDHHVGGRFIRIKNFIDFDSTKEVIPHGFYDTQTDKYLYLLHGRNSMIPSDVEIIGVTRRISWFFSLGMGRVWATHVKSHDLVIEAQLFDPVEVSNAHIASLSLIGHKLIVEALLVNRKAHARCRYTVTINEFFLNSMEVSTEKPEMWIGREFEFPGSVNFFSKLWSEDNHFRSMGETYSKLLFPAPATWMEYSLVHVDVKENIQRYIYRYWIHHKSGVRVTPRFSDEKEIRSAVFIPSTNRISVRDTNSLVYFSSTGILWQYTPTDEHNGELSALKKDVSHVLTSGRSRFVIDTGGVITNIMNNRKSQIYGYTTEALDRFKWSKEMKKNIASQTFFQFYQFEHTGLKASGFWYFPSIKSYAAINPSFDQGRFTVICALRHSFKALLHASNGTLWSIPLVRRRKIRVSSNLSQFVADYAFPKPKLWRKWRKEELISGGKQSNGRAILETKSGIILSFNQRSSRLSFHLESLRLDENAHVSRRVIRRKLRHCRSLRIGLPSVDYLPVWLGKSKAWAYNFKNRIRRLKYLEPDESHGEPLGVDERGNIILFEYASRKIRKNSRSKRVKEYSMANRVGRLLSLEASGEVKRISIPNLKGIQQVSMRMRGRAKRVSLPHHVKEIALDTLQLESDQRIYLDIAWSLSRSIQLKHGEEMLIKTYKNEAIYWKGTTSQVLKVRDSRRKKMRIRMKEGLYIKKS